MTSYRDKVDALEQKVIDECKNFTTMLLNPALQKSPNAGNFAKVDSHLSSTMSMFAKPKSDQAMKSTEALENIMEHKQDKQDQATKPEIKR